MELTKKEIIKVSSVKGMPSELIFYINDIFMIRRPPINLLKVPLEKGLPEEFVGDHKSIVNRFFQNYRPSEEDNLKLLELFTDPQTYEILKLLRLAIVTRDSLEKLKKKGVEDINNGLKKLWENNLVHVFLSDKGIEYYALISNFEISSVYPRYILNTILHQYDVKSKSEGVLIEYLKVLEDTYRPYKQKEKSKV
ncbi:MAG: hypothetical protein ACFFKA_09615 [Candidatus Thorarchaeota archaeon]